MISMVLSIIAFAGLVIAGFGVFVIAQNISRREPARLGVLITVVGIVIAALFFIMGAGVIEVQANEVGVVFNVLNGKLSDEPLRAGMHIIIPGIQEVTIYSIAQQEYTMAAAITEGAVRGEDAVEALTADGQKVLLDVTVIYRISPVNANEVHLKWQDRYQNGLIRPTLRALTREVLGQYDVQEIYGAKRTELATNIKEQAQSRLARDGFEVIDVLVRNIQFSEEYINSIEQKQVAQQQALEAEFRVQQREQEAEQQRALARGQADAVKIRAEGEAEALRLINEQLAQNPLLLQWRYIENLGDNVQMIIIPSNSPFLFDLEQLMQTAEATPQPGN